MLVAILSRPRHGLVIVPVPDEMKRLSLHRRQVEPANIHRIWFSKICEHLGVIFLPTLVTPQTLDDQVNKRLCVL